MEVHHWGLPRNKAVDLGWYRRLCHSCNATLGSIYKGQILVDSWEEQYKRLVEVFGTYGPAYPTFDGQEGWWSRLTRGEAKAFWTEFIVESQKSKDPPKYSRYLLDFTGVKVPRSRIL